MADDDDDKHAKYEASQNDSSSSAATTTSRRWKYYLMLFTLLADAYASRGACLMHLTIWSWTLHTLYFELPLGIASPSAVRVLHGPSLSGSWALMVMYFWTLFVNPQMEFDLAPEGRAAWLVYLRAAWLHVCPVLFHAGDLAEASTLSRLVEVYAPVRDSKLLLFWASVGGYFAMGLTWEQVNGDAAQTYNVEIVSPDVYVAVSKALGVASCLLSFSLITKPKLLNSSS